MSEIEDQDALFEAVKARMGAALPEHMRGWSAANLREALEVEILKLRRTGDGNHFRYYARNHLGLTGTRFELVKKWVSGSLNMSANEMEGVVETLVKRPVVPGERPARILAGGAGGAEYHDQPDDGEKDPVKKKLVDYTISALGSLADLLGSMEVSKADAYDAQRTEIANSFNKISRRIGLAVVFSAGISNNEAPVSSGDFNSFVSKGGSQ